MDNLFWNLDNAVRCAKENLGTNNDVRLHADAFLRSLNDEQEVFLLSLHYHESLLRVKRYMASVRNDHEMRRLHDVIFNNRLKVTQNVMSATRIFEELLKGVTFFEGENEDNIQPIYHRLKSRQMWNQCTDDMKRRKRSKVKKLIERCYIERLIYNELFIHESLFFPRSGDEMNQQDEGHVNWLGETLKDFQSCFPSMTITVSLGRYDGLMPQHIIINKYKRNNLLTKESYFKEVEHGEIKQYKKSVICSLETNRDGSKKRKIQSFEKERRWEKMV
jgi:hypothetical protein